MPCPESKLPPPEPLLFPQNFEDETPFFQQALREYIQGKLPVVGCSATTAILQRTQELEVAAERGANHDQFSDWT